VKIIKVSEMGTRLYPKNIEEVLIEKFGKQAVDDAEKFEKWLETFKDLNLNLGNQDSGGYAEYKFRKNLPVFNEIYDLRLFGYGKLNDKAWEAVKESSNHFNSSTIDQDLIDRLKSAMNVKDKVTGFHWG